MIKEFPSSPYNAPDKFGMEFVAEIEWENESYQFALSAVLREKNTGILWYADDQGCSCPTPFENTTKWERLFNLEPLVARRLVSPGVNLQDWENFKERVGTALRQLSGTQTVPLRRIR